MSNEQTSHHGLTIWTTAVFIIGEIAGGGVLALPKAVEDTGWIGIPLLVVFTLTSSYTGTIIAKSWVIIQDRFPEYRDHVPDPYPVIGEKAYGKNGRHLVTFSINFTLFGASTVYLILASENIEDLMSDVTKDISFCYWLLILGGILTPITCLGTPKDFWPIGVGATLSTGIACILILIQVLHDKESAPPVTHSSTDFMKFSAAFGTLVFSVSGHPAFPTFIADMKKKTDFKWAILVGYVIVMLMYLPTTTSGYFVYGQNLNPNIVKNMTSGPITYIIDILMTLHLIFGYIILINPVCQELEAKVGVPKAFTWKRCIARSAIVMVVLFVAESVPHFGAILSLIGGSTTTLLSYILPCVFYLKLAKGSNNQIQTRHKTNGISYQNVESTDDSDHAKLVGTERSVTTPLMKDLNTTKHDIKDANGAPSHSYEEQDREQTLEIVVPLWERVLNYEIILVGTLAGIAATVAAIKTLVSPDTFSVPCYINPGRI
ncbi:uncharacterized protein LOC127726769 [Mytilus californianus]|uniref:uncharacterized protein LOC127726769 n=1 Tax=Mytilus californianus TaxID=6549 RepID=UPI002245D7DF|nr:uncharacterized protein LOC127726769 [Mytilus californianus]